MLKKLALFPAVLAAGFASPATAAADDAEAVKAVVVAAYVEGVHAKGDAAAMRAGFHPAFRMDVLRDGRDALVVPRRDAARIATAVCTLIEEPELAARLSAGARETGTHYDIQAFVRKMEQLYVLLHETSRASKRQSVLQADLSFLTRT